MRLYVPATLDALRTWHRAGGLPASALTEAFEAPDETEEGEYAALMSAADVSASWGSPRRAVVVVEAPDSVPGSVIPLALWAAVHVDLSDRAAPDEDLGWYGVQEIEHL